MMPPISGFFGIECLANSPIFHAAPDRIAGNNISVHTPPIQTISIDDSLLTATSDDGDSDLVALKNDHRIENLRARQRAYVDATFEASPIARVIRRDWNILSAKLYINALSHSYRRQIEADMTEFATQVHETATDVRLMPFGHLERSWLRPRRMKIQVVHPITGMWLRSMRTLDEIYAILICAEKTGLISARKRQAIMLPCHLSYLAFKCTAMKIQLKTSDELLTAENL